MTFQAAITWRMPPFWTHDPALWFHHIEAQFSSHQVLSDASRLLHVIGSLSPEIMNVVRDIIIAPHEELGHRTPSQFLRRMKQLLGDESLPDKVFKQLFLQRLPSNTQVVLASTRESTSIEELAELADKIAERRSSSRPHRYGRRSCSPSASRNSHDTCWYHRKFGTQARKCTNPCSLAPPSSENGTGRN
uniref:DUF7041 domain-containing protein n=1 Tax=Octopus bimaculoides TaxID=37653 RepID=A0A0L8I7L5_OCTBM